jgi:hypothetical protein
MKHHLEMIKELKVLFAQSQKQLNNRDTAEQPTVFPSFLAGLTEAVPCYTTIKQSNSQSTSQPAVTITQQTTIISTKVKADISAGRLINLSSIQSYFRDLPTLIFDPGGGHNQS